MNMRKALHPRDDVDKLFIWRKDGGRGLASIEASIQRLEEYIEKLGERLITATRNNTDNTRTNTTTKNKK